MGMTWFDLTPEELCDLMCGGTDMGSEDSEDKEAENGQ